MCEYRRAKAGGREHGGTFARHGAEACGARNVTADLPVRELRLLAGAEFIVAITGEIMTMPGLPRVPSADFIRLNERGQIEGLF